MIFVYRLLHVDKLYFITVYYLNLLSWYKSSKLPMTINLLQPTTKLNCRWMIPLRLERTQQDKNINWKNFLRIMVLLHFHVWIKLKKIHCILQYFHRYFYQSFFGHCAEFILVHIYITFVLGIKLSENDTWKTISCTNLLPFHKLSQKINHFLILCNSLILDLIF